MSLVSRYGFGLQQNAIVRQRAQEKTEFQTAANKWMRVPVDVRLQVDPVPIGDRLARDAYWDNLIGASAALSDPYAKSHPMPIGDAVVEGPELGDLGQGILVIGKFESYRSFLSKSKRSLYTEIQFKVQHVFGHPNAPIQVGQLIDIDRPGGTIIAPWAALSHTDYALSRWVFSRSIYISFGLGMTPLATFTGEATKRVNSGI
jgi:hypothetical protein